MSLRCMVGLHRWRVEGFEHLGHADWYVGYRRLYCTRCGFDHSDA